MAKLLRVFLDTDLRCSHDGLTLIAKKHKISPEKLEPGEYLMFINTEKNKVKLYASNEVVAYLKLKHGKIDMRVVALIPASFEGNGKINYDQHLKEVLLKALPNRPEYDDLNGGAL